MPSHNSVPVLTTMFRQETGMAWQTSLGFIVEMNDRKKTMPASPCLCLCKAALEYHSMCVRADAVQSVDSLF
jgi:hypothetical protein